MKVNILYDSMMNTHSIKLICYEKEDSDCEIVMRENMNRRESSEQKRKDIVEFITKNPGTFFSEIKRHFNYSTGSLFYQLDLLMEDKEIFARYDGYWKRFYPKSMRRKRIFVEITPMQETIVGILGKSPGSSFMDIAGRLDRTSEGIMYHLKILVKKGIVRRKKIGRRYIYNLKK